LRRVNPALGIGDARPICHSNAVLVGAGISIDERNFGSIAILAGDVGPSSPVWVGLPLQNGRSITYYLGG